MGLTTWILIGFGIVIGYCLDEARLLWRRVREERHRRQYWAAPVARRIDRLRAMGEMSEWS